MRQESRSKPQEMCEVYGLSKGSKELKLVEKYDSRLPFSAVKQHRDPQGGQGDRWWAREGITGSDGSPTRPLRCYTLGRWSLGPSGPRGPLPPAQWGLITESRGSLSPRLSPLHVWLPDWAASASPRILLEMQHPEPPQAYSELLEWHLPAHV